MPSPTPSSRLISFGVFEVDLAAGELRKGGVKIKLQDQPFRVLAALLARPGEVVTREELREKLWRDGTFVDFDRGVNTAINKIREALGDSADTPRFAETLPRRGYRFVGPVEGAGQRPTDGSPDSTGAAPALPSGPTQWQLAQVAVLKTSWPPAIPSASRAATSSARSPESPPALYRRGHEEPAQSFAVSPSSRCKFRSKSIMSFTLLR